MMSPARATAVLAGVIGLGCGGTTAKVLERIDASTPPGSTLRLDAFLVRSVSTCVVGAPCQARDPSQCFSLADITGPQVSFVSDTIAFYPPADPRIQGAAQSACFRLTLDDAAVTKVGQLMTGLRAQVFQLSGGDINLDIRLHEVASIDAGFSRYYNGLFLEPSTLTTAALPTVNRETDFAYAITGFRDPDTGLVPKMDYCHGTNRFNQGVLGGSMYSWVAMSDSCAQASVYFRAWMIQLYYVLRDLGGLPDLYADNYPPCGQGDPDTTLWFPSINDCTRDPDAPACGQAMCPDTNAYDVHLLTKHWPRGHVFNGNSCSDGRMDRDETAIDSGGICDLIGH
jgi:hypothetical protein